MSGSDYEDSASISDDSQLPVEVDYPVGEEVEVPGTDGQLFKTLLTAGSGRRPVKGAHVSVHYVGTLLDGSEFDSSRKRGKLFEFQLAKGQVIKGWDTGVATMQLGEKCVLRCLPTYAYGAAGHPPTIPENATLLFEVELFAWTKDDDISEAKNRTHMKRTLIDGTGLENPDTESHLTLRVKIYSGKDATLDSVEEGQCDGSSLLWSSGEEPWEVEIGETALPPRFTESLKKLRTGEVAIFEVHPTLIPQEGCEAYHIPAHLQTALLYKVEVLSLSTVKTWEFHGMEKVTEGLKRKEKGNAALQAGDLNKAEAAYRRALEFIGEDFGLQTDEEKAAAKELRVVVWGNLAQALMIQGKHKEAVGVLKKAVDADPTRVKNLYRQAVCHEHLGNYEDAKQALLSLLSYDANNAEATVLLQKVKAEIKEYNQKQKSLFKRMFS